MSKYLFIKISTLLVSFCVVAYAIFTLKSSSKDSDGLEQLNWCHTRVVKLVLDGVDGFEEKNMKWQHTKTGSPEVHQVALEKWLGKNCTLRISKVPAPAPGALSKKLSINFVDKKELDIKATSIGVFQFNDISFQSQQLEEALKELKNLSEIYQ